MKLLIIKKEITTKLLLWHAIWQFDLLYWMLTCYNSFITVLCYFDGILSNFWGKINPLEPYNASNLNK